MITRTKRLVLAGAAIALLAGAGCGGDEPVVAAGAGAASGPLGRALGVCPPFPLRDEAGKVIDPIKGENDTAPYSPRQTCGAKGCHDYEKITRGFHFTQGKGEQVPALIAERYAWVTSPGNYGGNWCSPAPLYRQLAPKQNASARGIDMTSFDFVTATRLAYTGLELGLALALAASAVALLVRLLDAKPRGAMTDTRAATTTPTKEHGG